MKAVYGILMFITCLIPSLAHAQDKSTTVTITGKVLSAKDSMPMAFINIIDTATHLGISTDANGHFAVRIAEGHTIRFSAIGYTSVELTVTKSLEGKEQNIYLNNTDYQLGMVTIGAMNKRKFRDDFLNHVPDDSMPITLNLPPQPKHIPLEQTAPYPRAKYTGLGLAFGWSITLEKMQKSYKSIHKWQQNESVSVNATKRYNPELVKRLTGISEKDIEPFMKFCSIKPDVIAKSSDYELGEPIKQCYLAYQEQSKGH